MPARQLPKTRCGAFTYSSRKINTGNSKQPGRQGRKTRPGPMLTWSLGGYKVPDLNTIAKRIDIRTCTLSNSINTRLGQRKHLADADVNKSSLQPLPLTSRPNILQPHGQHCAPAAEKTSNVLSPPPSSRPALSTSVLALQTGHHSSSL